MLRFVKQNIAMLNVVLLSVILLIVVAPKNKFLKSSEIIIGQSGTLCNDVSQGYSTF